MAPFWGREACRRCAVPTSRASERPLVRHLRRGGGCIPHVSSQSTAGQGGRDEDTVFGRLSRIRPLIYASQRTPAAVAVASPHRVGSLSSRGRPDGAGNPDVQSLRPDRAKVPTVTWVQQELLLACA